MTCRRSAGHSGKALLMPVATIPTSQNKSNLQPVFDASSASLGNNAINFSAPNEVIELSHRQKSANSRFKLLDSARRILTAFNVTSPRSGKPHRTRNCLKHHAFNQEIYITLNEKAETSRAGLTGLQTCGSICSCPVCAQKKMIEYGNKIKQCLIYAERNNLRPVMVTLTAQHTRKMSLEYFKSKFRDAYNMFQSHRQFKSLKKSLDIQHSIISREVTVGKNGWHYHMHILYFVPVAMQKHAHKSSNKVHGMQKLWIDCLHAKGLRGVDKIALTATATADSKTYLAKFGFETAPDGDLSYELTRGDKKDSRTIWDVLASARYGDIDAETKFVEFVKAMRGHKWITFSNDFYVLCKDIELDAEEEPENQKLRRWLHVDPRDWYAVSALGMVANVVAYSAKTRCKHRVRDFIRRISDDWYYRIPAEKHERVH